MKYFDRLGEPLTPWLKPLRTKREYIALLLLPLCPAIIRSPSASEDTTKLYSNNTLTNRNKKEPFGVLFFVL